MVSRNTQIALSFVGVNLLLSVYDFAVELKSHVNADMKAMDAAAQAGEHASHADAMAMHPGHMPMWVEDALPTLEGVFLPLILLFAAAAIAAAVTGHRNGVYGLGVLAGITILWNAPDAVWHIQAGEGLLSVVCIVGVIMGLIAGRYVLLALKETPAEPKVEAPA